MKNSEVGINLGMFFLRLQYSFYPIIYHIKGNDKIPISVSQPILIGIS